jgi:hypothetical protein
MTSQYWTLLISKHHTIILCYIIQICIHMFCHLEMICKVLQLKEPEWKYKLISTAKAAMEKLKEYYSIDTQESDAMLLIAAMLDPSQKLKQF